MTAYVCMYRAEMPQSFYESVAYEYEYEYEYEYYCLCSCKRSLKLLLLLLLVLVLHQACTALGVVVLYVAPYLFVARWTSGGAGFFAQMDKKK